MSVVLPKAFLCAAVVSVAMTAAFANTSRPATTKGMRAPDAAPTITVFHSILSAFERHSRSGLVFQNATL